MHSVGFDGRRYAVGGLGIGNDRLPSARIHLQAQIGFEEPICASFPPGGSRGCCAAGGLRRWVKSGGR